MTLSTGPICGSCGNVVATVTFVTRSHRPFEPEQGSTVSGAGADAVAPAGAGRNDDEVVYEDGLCPDCLSVERSMGRLLATVVPFHRAGPGSGRRPRARPRRPRER